MRGKRQVQIVVWGLIFLCGIGIGPLWGQQATQSSTDVALVALVPQKAFLGLPLSIPITAMHAQTQQPMSVTVTVRLLDAEQLEQERLSGETDAAGRWVAQLEMAELEGGTYYVELSAGEGGQVLRSQVVVTEMPVLFVETDKPIYKPGQTIHGRVLLVSPDLRPEAGAVTVQIQDAKGIKVFGQALETNAFGVASFDLDLATELNTGVWKVTANHGSATGQVDVRVETYMLPRFEVSAELDRDFYLADEPITGVVKAHYFFGRPVDGQVEITARRYVGAWETYAKFTAPFNEGQAVFELPPVEYVSGSPREGGNGHVVLEMKAQDDSDHVEEVSTSVVVAQEPVRHQVIPLSQRLIPGQPLELLLVAETPIGQAVAGSAVVTYSFRLKDVNGVSSESHGAVTAPDFTGAATVSLKVPQVADKLTIKSSFFSSLGETPAETTLARGFSPRNCFIHLVRESSDALEVGQTAEVNVFQTHGRTVYYDLFARGHTLYSGFVRDNVIEIPVNAQMVPEAKLVAYVIGPDNEIAADTLDLSVQWQQSSSLAVAFDVNEALPGQDVALSVQSDADAVVGLAVVDKSVYALHAGRLHMDEVMRRLEDKFMEPQRQMKFFGQPVGARDLLTKAGLTILTTRNAYAPVTPRVIWEVGKEPPAAEPSPLVEVTYVRQFFPETWVWMPELRTDEAGFAALDLTAPDSITTWAVHAVATSEQGLAVGENELLVFQEFFGEPDLPSSVTRGDRFPLRVQVYNYLGVDQTVHVTLVENDWFKCLEPLVQQVRVPANSVSDVAFEVEAVALGQHQVEVHLQTELRADAVRRPLLVEAEGMPREWVLNGWIKAGESQRLQGSLPKFFVPGSEKEILHITPSLVIQTIHGLEDLLKMPYGCGEQNMMCFAPDMEVLRYLEATDQLTPEIRAKAEHYMNVGYQRQLTFQRSDGSFAPFGDGSPSPSLFLTAFVLSSFSNARDVQTIDERVLDRTVAWIEKHQLNSGTWERVGFVSHAGLRNGLAAKVGLTAYILNALLDYGKANPQVLKRATDFLIDHIGQMRNDPYVLALTALPLQRLERYDEVERILEYLDAKAIKNKQGMHWKTNAIETTAYVTLTFIERSDARMAETTRWLALQQNSRGGYRSTQDTVVTVRAMMQAALHQPRHIDLELKLRQSDGSVLSEITFDSENYDVLQTVVLPRDEEVTLTASGKGSCRYQLVTKYNIRLPQEKKEEAPPKDLYLNVEYETRHVQVNDIVKVNVTVRYLGSESTTGMMIVDVGVPTGFEPVYASLAALVKDGLVSRFEFAGRKVILYVDELKHRETRRFSFEVLARWPVRATIPDSQTYRYYAPEIFAETAGQPIVVEAISGGGR